jgi:hypothetical protein
MGLNCITTAAYVSMIHHFDSISVLILVVGVDDEEAYQVDGI